MSINTASDAIVPSGTLPTDITSSLTGEALAFETGADGDLYVYLSPDVQKDLNGVIKDKCTNTATPACEQAIQDVVDHNSVDIEKRGFAVTGFVIALVSVIIQTALFGKPELPHQPSQPSSVLSAYRVPGSHLAQGSAWASATSMGPSFDVIEASTTFAVDLPSGPSTATGLVPDVTTLASVSGGHNKGDAMISMPAALADKVQQVLENSNCTDVYLRKRIPGSDCLFSGAANLMGSAHPGGPTRDLVLIQHQVPLFRNQDVQRATGQAVALARQLAPELRISVEQAVTFGAVAVALTWIVLAGGQHINPINWVPASELTTGAVPTQDITMPESASVTATTTTSGSTSGCPDPSDEALICQSAYCGGDTAKSTCASGTLKNWPCFGRATRGQLFTQQYNTTFGIMQASYLNSLLGEMAAVTPTPDCSYTSAEKGFDGKPTARPASWCYCSQSPYPVNDIPMSTGQYSVLSPGATGSPACAYKTMPPTPITVAIGPTSTPKDVKCSLVTTRLASVPSGLSLNPNEPYSTCKCNNGNEHLPSTTSFGGESIPICEGTTLYFFTACGRLTATTDLSLSWPPCPAPTTSKTSYIEPDI